MPIKLPNLDDRTFADLVAEAHTLIPVHAPKWTNHNESDPGITLVELFAHLTEMQIYRLNRVTDANVCAFLKLIDGVKRTPSKRNRGMVTRAEETTEVALRDEVRDVVLKLRQQDRAISCEDFERLACEADQKVSRAYCIPQRNLPPPTSNQIPTPHVRVVVVPTEVLFDTVFCDYGNLGVASHFLYLGSSTVFESFNLNFAETGAGYTLKFECFDGKNWTRLTKEKHGLVDGTSNWTTNGLVTFTRPANWRPSTLQHINANGYWLRISSTTTPTKAALIDRIFRNLLERVREYLEPRRLLTTRVRVVAPVLVTIGVHVKFSLKQDAMPETVRQEVASRLAQFLNLETWPFGRNVYVSEIYLQLDRLPGVDYVTKIAGSEIITAHAVADADKRLIKQGTELVAIRLNPNELVKFSLANSAFEFSRANIGKGKV